MTFPKVCRNCSERRRMKGNFMCPVCHPDTSPDEYQGEFA